MCFMHKKSFGVAILLCSNFIIVYFQLMCQYCVIKVSVEFFQSELNVILVGVLAVLA
jgi:hypothetical protein